jgi:hypothetical protein
VEELEWRSFNAGGNGNPGQDHGFPLFATNAILSLIENIAYARCALGESRVRVEVMCVLKLSI